MVTYETYSGLPDPIQILAKGSLKKRMDLLEKAFNRKLTEPHRSLMKN